MLHQGGRRVLWPLARKPPVTRRLGICTCGITPILLNLHVLTHSQYTFHSYAEFSTLSHHFKFKFNYQFNTSMMIEILLSFLLLASAIVGGLVFLWNYANHETTAVWIGLDHQCADNSIGQDTWLETLADAAEETERLQKTIMDFYKSLMVISRPQRKQIAHAYTEVDLELGLQYKGTQTRDMSYKWSLPPITAV